MGLFGLFKKKEKQLTEKDIKWNNMENSEDTAEGIKKIHGNKHWLVLSVISLFFFVAGLAAADFMLTDFLIINIVDFTEVDILPCFVSVFIFLVLVLAFVFGRKAESSKLLRTIGFFGVISPLISIGALLPFGYQLISIFTEFPATIKLGELYFYYKEVFWRFDEFLPDSLFGSFISVSLVVLVLLFSLLGVVVGIFSFISASVVDSENTNKKTERTLKRFSVLVLFIALTAVLGTFAEYVYDQSMFYAQEKEYYKNEPLYCQELKEEMNSISLPMTTEEVLALAKEKEVSEYELADMKYSQIIVFSNDAGHIQLRDDDEDGIYETKRFFSLNCYFYMNEDEINRLKEASSLEELQGIIDYKYFENYYEIFEKDKVKISIDIRQSEKEPVSIDFEFEFGNSSQ